MPSTDPRQDRGVRYEEVAMSSVTVSGAARPARARIFGRHLLEMTLAMMVGMLAYGVFVGVAAAAAGTTAAELRVGQPELFAAGMAFAMSASMVAWMRRRGHSWRSGAEMSAAMVAPVVLFVGGYWLGLIAAEAVCALACAAMIPAMVAAMLYRLDHYTLRHTPAE
jgi:hypothetical protein